MAMRRVSLARFGSLLILFLLLFVVAGLLATSYSSAIAFLAGLFLVWLGTTLWPLARRAFLVRLFSIWLGRVLRPLARRACLLETLLVLFLVIFVVFLSLAVLGPQIANIFSRITSGLTGGEPFVYSYQVVIEPLTPSLESFSAREEIGFTLDGEKANFRFPEKQILSTSRGLLLRELEITPLDIDSAGFVLLQLPGGKTQRVLFCPRTSSGALACLGLTVVLKDWPKSSFYAAKGAKDLKLESYLDTETVSWSVSSSETSLRFAFIPSPFYSLRPLLAPFLGLTSLGDWLMTLLGLGGAAVVTPALKTALGNLAQSRLDAVFGRTPKQLVKKATLIISPKGEEKQVETKDDS